MNLLPRCLQREEGLGVACRLLFEFFNEGLEFRLDWVNPHRGLSKIIAEIELHLRNLFSRLTSIPCTCSIICGLALPIEFIILFVFNHEMHLVLPLLAVLGKVRVPGEITRTIVAGPLRGLMGLPVHHYA